MGSQTLPKQKQQKCKRCERAFHGRSNQRYCSACGRRSQPVTPTDFARLWSTPEAAGYVGLSVAALEQMRADRRGPRYLKLSGGKRGGVVKYRPSDVMAWLAAHEVEPDEESAA